MFLNTTKSYRRYNHHAIPDNGNSTEYRTKTLLVQHLKMISLTYIANLNVNSNQYAARCPSTLNAVSAMIRTSSTGLQRRM